MLRCIRIVLVALAIPLACFASPRSPAPGAVSVPVAFEANRGQFEPTVAFVLRRAGAGLSAQHPAVKLHLPQSESAPAAAVTMRILGAASAGPPRGEDRAAGSINYLHGSDPSHWVVDVPHYRQVRYPGVYPGIDLVLRAADDGLRYDFEVAAGVDPAVVRIGFDGVDRVAVDSNGDLELMAAGNRVQQRRLRASQEIDGVRVDVPVRYRLAAANQIGFEFGRFDPGEPLLIDPTLVYSSYLGFGRPTVGGEESDIAVDPAGNIYVAATGDLPATPGAFQSAQDSGYYWDEPESIFVAKLSPDGQTLIYATYLGGSADESKAAIAVDDLGYAYVTGSTSSYYRNYKWLASDFPTTAGAFKTPQTGSGLHSEAFLSKIALDGKSLVWSSRFGASDWTVAHDVALYWSDRGGGEWSPIVVGWTGCYASPYKPPCSAKGDFPVTPGAVQATHGGVRDAFAVRFKPDGSQLVYSTFLGGPGYDAAYGVAVDKLGRAYVVGSTYSAAFKPVATKAVQYAIKGDVDGFIVRLNAAGTSCDFSTYVGGSQADWAEAVALDATGAVYVAGNTSSADLESSLDTGTGFDTTLGDGSGVSSCSLGEHDAFVMKLHEMPGNWTVDYFNYIGGKGCEGAGGLVLQGTNAWVGGWSEESSNFPTTVSGPLLAQPPVTESGDGFLTAFSGDGNSQVYSTLLNGQVEGLAVGSGGDVYASGVTRSAMFRVTADAFQPTIREPGHNAFIIRLKP